MECEGQILITITGDTHGLPERFDSPKLRKLKKGDSLIICGDFGYLWNGDKQEERILERLSKKKYDILFVDGCHENYDLLAKYPVTEWNGGKVQQITGNIRHLMRGQVFELEGKTLFTFGGGESRDKQMYADMGKWWPEEMPFLSEMSEGIQNLNRYGKKVDYIITHSPAPRMDLNRQDYSREKNELEMFFEQLVKNIQFERWFFGSLHIDRRITGTYQSLFNEIAIVNPDAKKGKEYL